jgi:tetratricopeptide (TPR) repeat protein
MEAVLGFILLACSAPPPAPPPAKGVGPVEASIAHLDGGRPTEAVALLEPVVSKEPDNLPARFNLGIAYSMTGRDGDAIEAFRKVLVQSPKLVEAQLNLGQLLVKTGRFEESVPLLEAVSAAKGNDIRPAFLLARAWAGRELWKESAQWFQKAVQLAPDDQSILLEAASCYEKAGMKQEAIEAYRKSTDAGARERLGLLLMESGDQAGAAAAFEAVMKQSPSPAAAFALATIHLRGKQPAKAIPLAVYIVQKEPGNADARLFLGRLLRDEKRFQEAAEQFFAATKSKPGLVEAWNELAGMLMLTKNYGGAIAALDKSFELGGETPGYWWFRATAFDSLHNAEPALESYKKFLAQSGGKFPDEEFKARQRVRILEREVRR